MDIELKIKEQRTLEAIQKNFMGFEGKLFLICNIIGHAITKQSEDSSILETDDFWSIDDSEIPTFDESVSFHDVGYFYDGLSKGYPIEIICKEHEGTIKVFYKGYLCYEEEGGSLVKYVPHDDWENLVENLWKITEKNIHTKYQKYKADQKASLKKIEEDEIIKLRSKWGDII